jgi:hypothetical protein
VQGDHQSKPYGPGGSEKIRGIEPSGKMLSISGQKCEEYSPDLEKKIRNPWKRGAFLDIEIRNSKSETSYNDQNPKLQKQRLEVGGFRFW